MKLILLGRSRSVSDWGDVKTTLGSLHRHERAAVTEIVVHGNRLVTICSLEQR